jgi:hypothetical protein
LQSKTCEEQEQAVTRNESSTKPKAAPNALSYGGANPGEAGIGE